MSVVARCCMRVYKVVPCPGRVVSKKIAEAVSQIEGFANIIVRESVGGWELVGVMPVIVSDGKCGAKSVEEPYNAMIFVRDELKEVPKGSALEKQIAENETQSQPSDK